MTLRAGKLKIFGTRPNWVVSYIAYTKFHSPKPVFHSSGQIFTRIGQRQFPSLMLNEDHTLPHWGLVTHTCISKLTIIGSDNGLAPGRRQAIIWTNAGISSIGPLGTNFSETFIKIFTFSFKKMHLKMSGKLRPTCLGLNVLINSRNSINTADPQGWDIRSLW